MNRLIHITIAVLFFQVLNLFHSAIAQTLPVTSQLQLSPPYSVYFSDLLRPETDQVKLNLLLRDLQEPYVDVQLRLKVEGPGISLETAPWFNAPSITLESGIPQLLTSVELAPYFDAANLNFGGISRSKYEQQGGQLPEGLYRISFTVFDVITGRQLSQPGQAIAWMALSEPPRLNLPFCDTEINLENGQQYIVFQWSPVGVSPNTYGELEYEFTLTEIRPQGRDPYEAMRTLLPVYQFTTNETSLVYDNDEPLLIPGMAYAWRIQAKDVNGKERFREQGFSPVCMFRVAEQALPTASGVRAEAISSFQGRAYWDLIEEVEDYRVEYRSVDGSSGRWYGINEPEQPGGAIDGEINLTGLIPGKEYEVRVGSRRNGLVSSWSESVYFTTPEEQILACGDVPPSIPFGDFEPLENASVGDIIAAGDVNLTLVSFSGSNGVFSGWGTVKVNFLGNRIPVEFQDIKVNKDYRMVEGSLFSVQSNIDAYIKDWRDHQDNESDSVSTDTGNSDSGQGSNSNGDSQTDGDNTGDGDGDTSQGEDNTTDSESENGESNDDADSNSNTSETTGEETTDDSGDNLNNGGDNTNSGENGDATEGVYGPPIQILHDGTPYVDRDEIQILYDNENYVYTLELANYPEDANIRWEVYDMNNQSVTAFLTEGVPTTDKVYKVRMDKKYDKLRVVAYYNDKYLTVYLNREKPDFEIQHLWAIDNNNRNRKAHEGEILYLIRKENNNLRKVDYEIETDARNEDFWIDEPIWKTTANDGATSNFTRQTNKKKTSHYLSTWPSTNTTTLTSFGVEKSVKIQLIKENRVAVNVVPPATQFAIEKAVEKIDKISSTIKKLSGKGISVEPKVVIVGQQYNEEDPVSNLYYIVRSGQVRGGFSVSIKDIPIPMLTYSVPGVVDIGGYLTPSVTLQMYGGKNMKKIFNEEDFVTTSNDLGGRITGGVEIGVKFDLDTHTDYLEVDIRGYGGLSITGDIKYRMETNNTSKVRLTFYADPLKVGFIGKVKAAGVKLLDVKLEEFYGERISFTNEW